MPDILTRTYIPLTDDDLRSRPRRNRRSQALRDLVEETSLRPQDFVLPLFLLDGDSPTEEVTSMPGVFRRNIDDTCRQLEQLAEYGLRAVDLFPVIAPERKDSRGSEAVRAGNQVEQAVRAIKSRFPELCVMVDVALDPYTSHGHDGVLDENGLVLNDESLEILVGMSLLAADAGADVIAPSDMMDGRVLAIRRNLDAAGYQHVGIMSYTAKYCSAFYGPFRDALHSAPKTGDKKNYQMNPANVREACLEADLDEAEGADIMMVKPALPYLDILVKLRERTNLPLAAYQVSGEYAMIMAAAQNNWIDGDRVMFESLTAIKRAGADMILSYATPKMLLACS